MAEFLTTHGTASSIETIMRSAKKEMYLVSPYLQISETFYQRLKEASDYGVHIIIVYGKDKLNPNERESLAFIPNLELYFCKNLHAKCYFNESKMVITSMNMYEFSEKNNREMGVLVDVKNDEDLFENAKRETLAILKISEKISLPKKIKDFSVDKIDKSPINSLEPKTPKQSSCKYELTTIDKYLCDEFKDSRINAASDYLFSKNLVPIFHVFITSSGISLKYPVPKPIIEEVNSISSKLNQISNYRITIKEPINGYQYYIWEIGNIVYLTDYSKAIYEIKKIKF